MAASVLFAVVQAIAISRDFGWFLFGVLLVPFLLLLTLACAVWRQAERRGGRSMSLAMLILAATVPAVRPVQMAWDWTSVALWSLSHRQEIAAASGKDAIVTGWGDWGMAGDSTFAYVITDARDDSRSSQGAERWRQRLKLDCPVVDSQRIWSGLYLVETSNCPFNGIAVPEG